MAQTCEKNEFSFPFKPYPIQVAFMKELYNTLKDGKVGIFESPTGTGKTLSIVCGALTWLDEATESGTIPALPYVRHEKKIDHSIESSEPNWVVEHERKEQELEKSRKLAKNIEKRRKFNKRLLDLNHAMYSKRRKNEQAKSTSSIPHIKKQDEMDEWLLDEYASDDGRRLRKFSDDSCNSSLDSEDEQTDDEQLEITKIYFCSRTHSQLSQFVKELKKTSFGANVKCITLGSRKSLCVHEGVNRLSSDLKMTDKCLDLRKKTKKKKDSVSSCPYIDQSTLTLFRDHSLATIRDIEELYHLGKKLSACSYYGTRKSIKYAEVVALPYSLLLNRSSRETVGIDLKGNIIICDEAHNLIDAINQVYSARIDLKGIARAHEQVSSYLERYQKRLKGKNIFYIQQLLGILQRLIKFIRKNEDSNEKEMNIMNTINDFLFHAEIDVFNIFKLQKYMSHSQIAQKVMGLHEHINKLEMKDDFQIKNISPLRAIGDFLMCLTNADKDGRILVDRVQKELKFLMLNPGIHFKEIVNEARSVVLAGGTMQPVNHVTEQLFSHVPKESINLFSCGHVIPSHHLMALTLVSGPTEVNFDFTYKNRHSQQLMDEVGRMLVNLTKVVPGGIICFFSSYSYIEKVVHQWKTTGAFSLLEKKKKVFQESKTAVQREDIFMQYSREIKEGNGGAILLSVVGGKLSEGINFSDELARCVVMVGMPYADIKDLELQEKMKYLDTTSNSLNAGREYYENLCLKAVNQSIGRSIRHIQDYASILLIDQRYSQEHVIQRLPNWIKDRLKHTKTFGAAFANIVKFYKLPR